jgi:hypothetical protein
MNTIDVQQQNSDTEIEGQMSIFDYFDMKAPSPMVATSKVFARAIKEMNLAEWKTFILALTQIRWKEKNCNKVHLDKWNLVKILGLKANETDVSAHLKRAIGNLPKNSFIEFENTDQGYWDNGTFVTRIRCYKDYVLVCFNSDYLPLFEELDKDRPYITMWAEDLFKMTSERSILLYEHLRLHSDTRKTNTRLISTRDFKTLFGIPKEAYVNNGHFERTLFERKVIEPVCDDLLKSKMITLHIQEDGKPYKKIKYHGKIRGYELSWDVSDHPAIVSGDEAAELRDTLAQNPKVLKVAKDIVDGKQKPKYQSSSKKAFSNYEQGENVDYDALWLQREQQKGE